MVVFGGGCCGGGCCGGGVKIENSEVQWKKLKIICHVSAGFYMFIFPAMRDGDPAWQYFPER